MNIKAAIKNGQGQNEVVVETEGKVKTILIPAKDDGQGSAVNGGELLFLSLATCFCNDLYREAAKRKIQLESVDVMVNGYFGQAGEPASAIEFEASVKAPGSSEDEINELIFYVNQIAEVHNTLRKGTPVTLKHTAQSPF